MSRAIDARLIPALAREPAREDPPPPRKGQPAQAKPGSLRWMLPWALLPPAMLIPLMPGLPTVWVVLTIQIGIAAIVALGLVVLSGTAALCSFGQAVFVGSGAYAAAVLGSRYGLSPWAGLGGSLLASGILAAVLAVLTMRLERHYLAMATMAANVVFIYLIGQLDSLNRDTGFQNLQPVFLLGVDFSRPTRFYYLVLGALALCMALTSSLIGSRMGRSMRALRAGRLTAETAGVNSDRARLLAFTYAAVLAGLAGWLTAHFQRAVEPSAFGLEVSLGYLLMAMAGGISHIGGAVLGAALVVVIRDQLQATLPLVVGVQGNVELLLFGGLLVLLMQFAPSGLWPQLARPFPRRAAPAEETEPEEQDTLGTRPRLPPGTELLRVEGLHKRFGDLTAVQGLGFALKAGEIVGLIGPNGAGKSTTFNLLTGVLPATRGQVAFLGRTLGHASPRSMARLGLARSFQRVHLIPKMTVLENVLLGTHSRGRAGALRGMFGLDQGEEAALRAEALRQIARVGLAEYAHRIADELPLGRQRLVEIARVLCLDPVALLLDEPAAGLRHRDKAELADLLESLRRDGLGILLVEHDMDFVMRITDHLVVMNFGTELAHGTPREIRRNPAVIEAYLGSAM